MPSSLILENKKAEVARLSEAFKAAETIVLADYRGITVEQDTELRNELRKAGVTYSIVKNTLAARAAKELGYDALEEVFKGPTAVAYSDSDPVAPARILKAFEKNVINFRSRVALWKDVLLRLKKSTLFLKYQTEKYCFPNLLAALFRQLQVLL